MEFFGVAHTGRPALSLLSYGVNNNGTAVFFYLVENADKPLNIVSVNGTDVFKTETFKKCAWNYCVLDTVLYSCKGSVKSSSAGECSHNAVVGGFCIQVFLVDPHF